MRFSCCPNFGILSGQSGFGRDGHRCQEFAPADTVYLDLIQIYSGAATSKTWIGDSAQADGLVIGATQRVKVAPARFLGNSCFFRRRAKPSAIRMTATNEARAQRKQRGDARFIAKAQWLAAGRGRDKRARSSSRTRHRAGFPAIASQAICTAVTAGPVAPHTQRTAARAAMVMMTFQV
jgi:hypothetical protein